MGISSSLGYSIDDLAGEAGRRPSTYTECYRALSTGCNGMAVAYFTGSMTCSNAPAAVARTASF